LTGKRRETDTNESASIRQNRHDHPITTRPKMANRTIKSTETAEESADGKTDKASKASRELPSTWHVPVIHDTRTARWSTD